MVAKRALTLASAILIVSGSFMAASAPAFAQSPVSATFAASNNKWAKEDPTPSPSSTELSEAAKQAAEKIREAAKQAAEKTREAAKQAAEKIREATKQGGSNSGRTTSQLQLPPLIIRPAQPGDNVESDSQLGFNNSGGASGGGNGTSTGSNGGGSQTNNVTGSSSGGNTGSSAANPAASSGAKILTSGAGTGSKKLFTKPSGLPGQSTSTGNQRGSSLQTTGSGAGAGLGSGSGSGSGAGALANKGQNSGANSGSGKNSGTSKPQVTYVVSPLSQSQGSSAGNGQNNSVTVADPTANDPIRLVSAATLKTPADQFFELAGYGVLALAAGVAGLVGLGVYRGIRSRRSEAFDFEYRS